MEENNALLEETYAVLTKLAKYSFNNKRPNINLTNQEYLILFAINNMLKKGEIVTPSKLIQKLAISKESLSRSFRHLRMKGYVYSTRDPKEFRRIRYHLKPAGIEILSSLEVEGRTSLKDVIKIIGQEDAEHLIRIITKLLTEVELRCKLKGEEKDA